MTKKIKFDEHDFSSHVARIEKGRETLAEVKPSIADRESKSKAMDEFEKRFREMDEFVQEYRTLLDKDVSIMRKTAATLKLTDSKIASSLKSSVTGISQSSAMGGGESMGGR